MNFNKYLPMSATIYARLKFSGMVIGICSQNGGVGKTTTAVHLAAILNESAPVF
jgi:Mrp family chromosome partitioning ATPase